MGALCVWRADSLRKRQRTLEMPWASDRYLMILHRLRSRGADSSEVSS